MAPRNLRFGGLAVALTSIFLALPAAANANDVYRACDKSGHTLNVHWYYSQTTTTHYWDNSDGTIGGNGTGGKSNINWTLKVDTTTIYNKYSPDSIRNDEPYEVIVGKTTKRSADEKFYVKAIFDVRYSDPSCTALLDY